MKTKKMPSRNSTKNTRHNETRSRSQKRKAEKTVSFRARSNEIHDSLDHAIRKIESGELNAKSAKEILQRIDIVQTLLGAAKIEIQNWLKIKTH